MFNLASIGTPGTAQLFQCRPALPKLYRIGNPPGENWKIPKELVKQGTGPAKGFPFPPILPNGRCAVKKNPPFWPSPHCQLPSFSKRQSAARLVWPFKNRQLDPASHLHPKPSPNQSVRNILKVKERGLPIINNVHRSNANIAHLVARKAR